MQEPVFPVRDAYAGKLFLDQQVSTFRNIDRLFPSRTIHRRGAIKPLPQCAQPLNEMQFRSQGEQYDLYDYVSRNRVAALLILQDGKIAFENYQFGNDEHSRWMSMSMAKSISTTLVGAAVQDGLIADLDDPLSRYMSELSGGNYEQVTVRQLLLMTSGVLWNEDQTDENSERRQVLELQIAQQPGAIVNYMSRLPRLAPPGQRWNYSTGETHLVGALIRTAAGKWAADYLTEKIWSRLGMESDANWWLESADGLEVAGSGISATLRDYGRFGLFVQNGGIIEGERVLPEGWVEQAAGPTEINGEQVPYGYMWWSVPDSSGSFADRAFSARGIFGQRLYINPKRRVVIVVWSARSKPMGDQPIDDNDFFNAVAEQL